MVSSLPLEITTGTFEEEIKIFDFSHYPHPAKDKGVVRFFYNNVNGLEINAAINARITNIKGKKKIRYNKTKGNIYKNRGTIKSITYVVGKCNYFGVTLH